MSYSDLIFFNAITVANPKKDIYEKIERLKSVLTIYYGPESDESWTLNLEEHTLFVMGHIIIHNYEIEVLYKMTYEYH